MLPVDAKVWGVSKKMATPLAAVKEARNGVLRREKKGAGNIQRCGGWGGAAFAGALGALGSPEQRQRGGQGKGEIIKSILCSQGYRVIITKGFLVTHNLKACSNHPWHNEIFTGHVSLGSHYHHVTWDPVSSVLSC